MAKIYSYSSNYNNLVYTVTMTRTNGTTVQIVVNGTIYNESGSSNGGSGDTLYGQLRYNVSPSQTNATASKGSSTSTIYVSNYGTLLNWSSSTVVSGYSNSTNSSCKIADNASANFPSINSTGFPSGGRSFTITYTKTTSEAINLSNVAFFIFPTQTGTTAPSSEVDKVLTFIGQKSTSKPSLSVNYERYYTQSLSVGVGYSATSAPTSISIKDSISIQKPNAEITIQWSGATAGTSNPINGYQVYGGTSSNPTTLLATVTSTSTSSSYKYTIPSTATRGSTYYFRVKTTGTAGSSYYSGYSGQVSCKVNTLPAAPTITISQGTTTIGSTIYRNKTGTTTVRFTPSATSTDSQTNTYYYATSSTGTKTAFTSNTNFTPNKNTTYYFWSYDTMEFSSSYTTKTITIGANLTGSMGNTTSTTTYSNNGTTYTTAGTNTVTLSSAGAGTKTYKWSLVYGPHNSSMTSTQSLSSTSSSCTWAYAGSNGWLKDYQIKCVVSDQLSQSFTVTSSTYTIPSAPTFNANIYNQLGTNVSTMPTANVAGSVANNFYQTVVTSLTKDTSISLTFSLTPTATVGWYSGASNTTYRSSGVIPLTISGASRDTSYTLRITATAVWGNSFYKDYTIKRTGEPKVQIGSTIRNFSSDDITLHGTEVKPFTSTADLNFSFKLGLTGYNFTEGALKNAGAFLFANSTKVRIENESRDDKTTPGEIIIKTTQGGENPDSGLYNWNTNTLKLNINSATNPVSFRIEFTNVFGETFYYTKSGLNFNFISLPEAELTMSGATNNIIKQDDTLIYSIGNSNNKATTYSEQQITFMPQIYRSDIEISDFSNIQWSDYGSSITDSFSRDSENPKSAIKFIKSISFTVGEIEESQYCYFRVIVTQNNQSIFPQASVVYISQRHCVLEGLEFDQQQPTYDLTNKIFGYSFTLPALNEKTDYGAGIISGNNYYDGITNAYYGIQFSTTSDFSSATTKWLTSQGELSSNQVSLGSIINGTAQYSGSNIDLSSLPTWQFYNIRVVYWSKIGDNIKSITKTTYGKTFLLYNSQPTVSYRQNQVGININGIETNHRTSAVVIGSTSGKNLIKLYSATKTATINLDTGVLDGFIFDGGTWDQS